MATHPYISGAGNVTQMIGYLRKNFPATVNSDTVKKLGLAPNNESYVINVLQFLKLIDEEGKRTDKGHQVMTTHDDMDFQKAFSDVIQSAYVDLFELRGEGAWTLTRTQLVGYFRSSDKTSEVIGGRQAGVFIALRELGGHETKEAVKASAARPASAARSSTSKPRKAPPTAHTPTPNVVDPVEPPSRTKADMALTVRIEINLPAGGTQETYDAIFKSIKANLFP